MAEDLLIYKQHYTINRELSWLRFNDRVLNEAKDNTVPILERLKFISIFTSNLEEFFMIRVGSLDAMKSVKVERDPRSGMTPAQQLKKIYLQTDYSIEKRDKIFLSLIKKLEKQGILLMELEDLSKEQKKFLKNYFKLNIKPLLSPQIVDSHHPFPNLQTGITHISAYVNSGNRDALGIIAVPKTVPSIIKLQGKGKKIRFVKTSDVIIANLDTLFAKSKISEASTFIITRNADVNPDDEVFSDIYDYRKKVMKTLLERKRMTIVHALVSSSMSQAMKKELINRLNIDSQIVDSTDIPLDISFCSDLAKAISDPNMEYPNFSPKITNSLDYTKPIFDQILDHDVILHYPYNSMEPFLQLIKEAATDPDVLSIKITIYRLAKNARLVEYLCQAAENGKEVVTLIELKARFDEQNNMDYSKRLEEAGCTILYGFENYKVHSKICQITRKKGKKLEYVTQIGTGNYNENTAKIYTDLSYITGNKKIAKDSQKFFNNMMIGKLDGKYDNLLIAPFELKPKLLSMMDEEIAKKENGRIYIKCNSLTDIEVIEKLKEASNNNVDVKLIVRGICSILPGIEGKTDNLVIRNVVGRFLEHSRIYIFGKESPKVYISSADLMTRNTEKRVEIASPILDLALAKELVELFSLYLRDNTKAREMSKSGAYKKVEGITGPFSIQDYLMEYTEGKTTLETKTKGKIINSFKVQYHKK